jgi:hypothetical protein
MTSQKLKKIKQEIAAARQRTNKYRDLEKIAIGLERALERGRNHGAKNRLLLVPPLTALTQSLSQTIPGGTSQEERQKRY